jgi:putative nucleotidyltransferase with HDIG domain
MPKLRRIHIDQARVGMYVADLVCDWASHPFWMSRFSIRDVQQIAMLRQEGIHEFYIDTSKGLDVAATPAQTVHAATASLPPQPLQAGTPLGQELLRAREIIARTEAITRHLLNDARVGQPLQLVPLRDVCGQLAGSLDRNALALNILSHMYRKDEYTFQHSISVGLLLMILHHHLGSPADIVVEVGLGGILHDIGKTRIPGHILNKPGQLDAEERQQMKQHVGHSRDILDENGIESAIIRAIALQHHERFDGSGYPLGLAGNAISRYGQQAAIIDVYDALTSDRCYHKGMPAPAAIKRLFEWSTCRQFDPAVVGEIVRCFGIYPPGTLVRLQSGKLAVVQHHGAGDLTRPEVLVFFDTQRNQLLKPHKLNLAIRYGAHADDRIVSNEPLARWLNKLPDLAQLIRHCE